MEYQSREKLGPGTWYTIHMTASWVDQPEKVPIFCSWIRQMQKKFWCQECAQHFGEYLEAHPPEKAPDLFIWSWEFHNAVNQRLGKKQMPYNTAKGIYLEGTINLCPEEACHAAPTGNATNLPKDTFKFRPSRESVKVK